MHNETIARNYAEALLVLAQRAEDLDGWGKPLARLKAMGYQEQKRNQLSAQVPT